MQIDFENFAMLGIAVEYNGIALLRAEKVLMFLSGVLAQHGCPEIGATMANVYDHAETKRTGTNVYMFGRIRHLCKNLVALFHEAAIHQQTFSILRHSSNTRRSRNFGMSAFGLSPMSNDMSRIGHLRVSWHG